MRSLVILLATALVSLGSTPCFSDVEILDPHSQPQFINPLPIPPAMPPADPSGTHYEISVSQFEQNLGLVDPVTGAPMLTTVWGYNGTYPGRTIEARRGTPITVRWTNHLVDEFGAPLPHLLPVDTSVHWAAPVNWPASGVPIVTHLHGGHSEAASDGLPEQWFTPGFALKGPDWVQETFNYDNTQEPATLWYHDHALGITRLNVYAGLAGYYLLRDDWEDSLNLPSGPYEVPLAIQDRMFTTDGELFIPSEPEVEGAPEPSILPEFFGNIILVNGKATPYLEVRPRKYRFRILNGSDSRFYTLRINTGMGPLAAQGPQLVQIGTDSGLLNEPVPLDQLTLGPGERADVVVNFAGFENRTLVLRNNARAPFPMGEPIDPQTVGRIMTFRVAPGPVVDDSSLPAVLRPAPVEPLTQTGATRQLLLFEGTDEYGRLQPLLGTAAGGKMLWSEPITEMPTLNDVEVWEIFNATEDAHPIHLHLVTFQILDRQKFKAHVDEETGALTNIRKIGQPSPPNAEEAGWKDTAKMFPGEVTRVIAKFDRLGEYAWHCHILSHEDHEMMRPYEVVAPPQMLATMTSQATNEFEAEASAGLSPAISVGRIYDVTGRMIREVVGEQSRFLARDWNGTDDAGRIVPPGVYFWKVRTPERTESGKKVIVR